MTKKKPRIEIVQIYDRAVPTGRYVVRRVNREGAKTEGVFATAAEARARLRALEIELGGRGGKRAEHIKRQQRVAERAAKAARS